MKTKKLKIIVFLILNNISIFTQNLDSIKTAIRMDIMKNSFHGQYEKNIKLVNQLIEFDSLNPDLYIERASYYSTLEQYKLSNKDFFKALALGVDTIKIYSRISSNYKFKNDYNKALNWIDKAINIYPDSAYLYIKRSNINVLMKKNDSILMQDLLKAKELGSKRAEELIQIMEENPEPYYEDW